MKREDGVVAVSSKTINITTTYDDGAAGIVRKFTEFHETNELDKVTKCAISYVFDAKLSDAVTDLLKSVRKRKHASVCWYPLASHRNSPCSGLFEAPTDHYHLIAWFVDKAKSCKT